MSGKGVFTRLSAKILLSRSRHGRFYFVMHKNKF